MSSVSDYLDVQMENLIPSLRYFKNHFFGSPQTPKKHIIIDENNSNNNKCHSQANENKPTATRRSSIIV
ncbi:hypothetical protein DICPUDRAFT_155544 [Dictyostelium purpureum]|uniref:Uncharacterized protein n=1 Tax=Dictyostelium purpureum TaxID=5786 RepID=F0ZUA2_DICPU|nr:uncharacterized protein DICPUDRAFT_155544 [Dictyostelium purpureum]EGC32472.1 hypothetical protein DICPUDRAFT_155544 [Dictyostelium purpureum]|eukprot:XP_003291006.1 hypothetical protein DICPUDRAFT_155544 [Dictyostelium purpureum]